MEQIQGNDNTPVLTLGEVATHIGTLVRHFDEHAEPAVRDAVFELLDGIDALHRAGVTRLVELLVEATGADVMERLAADHQAAPVLDLYDLLPLDDREQIDDALESVRPYIHSHGGEVEVLDVVDGIVHVRLQGACSGCAGSAVTLRRGVEEALRNGYTGFQGMEVHEPEGLNAAEGFGAAPAPSGFVSLEGLKASAGRFRKPEWTVVAAAEDVPEGSARAFESAGFPVLLCNVDGEIYGFRNECLNCGMPIGESRLSGPVVVCPWQNCAYDARTGRRVDGEDGRLQIYPVALVNGEVKLALNVPQTPAGPAQ